MLDQLLINLPAQLSNPELQAVCIAGLTGVGAWVLFSWILKVWMSTCCCLVNYPKVVLSIIWPFITITLVLFLMPSWREALVNDLLPKQVDNLRAFLEKLISNMNAAR